MYQSEFLHKEPLGDTFFKKIGNEKEGLEAFLLIESLCSRVEVGNGDEAFIKAHSLADAEVDVDELVADAFAAEILFNAEKSKVRKLAVHTHHIIDHKTNGLAGIGFGNNYVSAFKGTVNLLAESIGTFEIVLIEGAVVKNFDVLVPFIGSAFYKIYSVFVIKLRHK